MSRIKRYVEHIYYDMILEGRVQELIKEGMSLDEINQIRQLFERDEERL